MADFREKLIVVTLVLRGGSRTKLRGGQLIIGALINFQKFVTREPTTRLLYTIISDPNY